RGRRQFLESGNRAVRVPIWAGPRAGDFFWVGPIKAAFSIGMGRFPRANAAALASRPIFVRGRTSIRKEFSGKTVVFERVEDVDVKILLCLAVEPRKAKPFTRFANLPCWCIFCVHLYERI